MLSARREEKLRKLAGEIGGNAAFLPSDVTSLSDMQYTGLTEVTGHEPPTYNRVGTDDWIADYRTMQ